jgi:hypothetical protein
MTNPPETLTEPMEADPSTFDATQLNFLLASLVLPRADRLDLDRLGIGHRQSCARLNSSPSSPAKPPI